MCIEQVEQLNKSMQMSVVSVKCDDKIYLAL